MKTNLLSLVLIFGVAALPRLGATPVLYGSTQTGDLFQVDPTTAVTTLLGSIAGTPSIVGLAVSNNHLYALDANTGNVLELNTANAATINTINLGLGAAAVGEGDIAFDGSGANFNGSGTMYIASAAFPTVKFYSATLTNSTTGTNSLLKTCGTNPCPSGETRIFFDGISFVGSTLYGLQQGGAGLYTINTGTGVPTLAGSTGIAAGNANGALTTRFTDNQLFGVLSNNIGATLYMFTVTGTPTLIGALSGSQTNVTGLAFVDVAPLAVPEPSTMLLLSSGLLLMACRAARSRRRC